MADAVDTHRPVLSNLYTLQVAPDARMRRFRVNISCELRDERPASEDPLHGAVENDYYSFESPFHQGDTSPVTVLHPGSSSALAPAPGSVSGLVPVLGSAPSLGLAPAPSLTSAAKSSSSARSALGIEFPHINRINTETTTEAMAVTSDAAFKRVVFDYFTSQFDIFLPLPLAYAGGKFAYASNGVAHLPDAAIGMHAVKVNVSPSGTIIPMQYKISRDVANVIHHAKVDLQFSDAGVVSLDGTPIEGAGKGTGVCDDGKNEETEKEDGKDVGFHAIKAIVVLAERIARYALKSQCSHGIRKSYISNSSFYDHGSRDLYVNALSVVPAEAPRVLCVASGFAIALQPLERALSLPSMFSLPNTDLRTAGLPISTLTPSSVPSRDPFRRHIHSVLSGLSNLARRAPAVTLKLPKSCTTDACNLHKQDFFESRVFMKTKVSDAGIAHENRSLLSKSVCALSQALKDLDYNVTLSLTSISASSWRLACPRRVPRVHALQNLPLFVRPARVENWVILADHALPHSMARSFASSLISAASRRGVRLHEPMIHSVPPAHFATFFRTIMENFDDIASFRQISSSLNVVVVLQALKNFNDDGEHFSSGTTVASLSSTSLPASSDSSAFPSLNTSDPSIVASATKSRDDGGVELSKECTIVCELADIKYGIPTMFVNMPTNRSVLHSKIFDSLVCRFNVIAGGYNTMLDMPPPPPPPPPPLPMNEEQPWEPPHAVVGLSVVNGIAAAVARYGSQRACAVRSTNGIGSGGSAATASRAIFMQLWEAPSVAVFHQTEGVLSNEDIVAVERAARACGVPRILYIGIDQSHSAAFDPSPTAPSAVALEAVGGIRYSNMAGVFGDFFLLSMAGAKPCRYTVLADDTKAPPTALHAWTLRHCYGDIPNPAQPLPVVTCVHQARALARRAASYITPVSRHVLNSNFNANNAFNRKQPSDSSRQNEKKSIVESEFDEYDSQHDGYTTLDADLGSVVEDCGIHPNLMPYLFYV